MKNRNLHSDKVIYEKAKQQYKTDLNNAKADYEDKLVDSISDNPKKFYIYEKFVNSRTIRCKW